MKKSIFKVEWTEARLLLHVLKTKKIPFAIEAREGVILFAFNDLPVRQFGMVWKLFKDKNLLKGG